MKSKVFAFALFATVILRGQESTMIAPPRVPEQWDQLKQYLVLTEAQVTTLGHIQTNRIQAEQVIYTQMSDKQRQINNLLEQGSNDAGTIGRLMVEINNLRKQLPLNSGPYRTQALAVLTDAQKAKLPVLAEALQLQTTAWQAVELNLVERPAPDYRILPAPVPAIGPSEAATSSAAAR